MHRFVGYAVLEYGGKAIESDLYPDSPVKNGIRIHGFEFGYSTYLTEQSSILGGQMGRLKLLQPKLMLEVNNFSEEILDNFAKQYQQPNIKDRWTVTVHFTKHETNCSHSIEFGSATVVDCTLTNGAYLDAAHAGSADATTEEIIELFMELTLMPNTVKTNHSRAGKVKAHSLDIGKMASGTAGSAAASG